ncbi:aminotransferase class IV [Sulfurimonas sp.]|uniref:aminotransferase class IV n=1 Tax=Sulfurimonas sp. TaxID=2022749 RepID=UPI0025E2D594|nr:aminotransferase class IV [Sulfurimonas sp.]
MNKIFFETIKAVNGKIYHLEYHQKRYEKTLNDFSIKIKYDLRNFIDPPKDGVYRCRLVYDITKSPHTICVTYHEYKKRDINLLRIINCNDIDYGYKYESRKELNDLFELRDKCDDILIIRDDLVTDTTIANIAFWDDGKWITPRKPLLMGVTRARLLDDGKIFEADIYAEDIKNFTKVALLNAMIDFDIIMQNKKDIFC